MSTPEPAALCPYCHRPIDPVNDCWIGHSTVAHYQCAWAADEAFWVILDAEEGKEVAADASQSSRA
jgi:hypothetical protein